MPRDFIGKGWSYPFRFDPRTGGVSKDVGDGTAQKINRVRMSLFIIVSIKKGELYFGRRFGSRFRNLIFAVNTANLVQRTRFEVFAAFEDPDFGERRAFVESLVVTPPLRHIGSPRLEVEVQFVLRGTNAEGNLVFPFYLNDRERDAAERGLTDNG